MSFHIPSVKLTCDVQPSPSCLCQIVGEAAVGDGYVGGKRRKSPVVSTKAFELAVGDFKDASEVCPDSRGENQCIPAGFWNGGSKDSIIKSQRLGISSHCQAKWGTNNVRINDPDVLLNMASSAVEVHSAPAWFDWGRAAVIAPVGNGDVTSVLEPNNGGSYPVGRHVGGIEGVSHVRWV